MPRRVVSGNASIRDLVTKEKQEDEEHGIEEEDGRKTEPAGAKEPRRKPGDRWPGEPAPKPPCFRRSVASPGTETRAGKGGGRLRVTGKREKRRREGETGTFGRGALRGTGEKGKKDGVRKR
ncbi:hypothetical protein NDU88_004047 [Pleurodeles waltl]|uniref:Uncharacterized protein n=1 Tax=Pleurodeles waltl TaxID=8319 RepID=A0AAV7LK95_PLEWA|nr:hypothetical protein NDU88_004047 [Pleurodeles waltl]